MKIGPIHLARTVTGKSALATAVGIWVLSATAMTPMGEVTAAHPGAPAASRAKLICNGQTEPGKPIRISPAVNGKLKHTTVSGSVPLDSCTSPDGSHRNLRSARLDFRLTGQASCTEARNVKSVAHVTWYSKKDQAGRVIGTSRLYTPAHSAKFTPGRALPELKIISGPLAGSVIKAGASGSPAQLNCRTRGVRSLAGAFWAFAR